MTLVMEVEARNTAQRYAIIFFFFGVKLGDSATITHGKLLQTFGDVAVSRAQAFRWHKMFSASRTFIENEQRSGRPSATRRGDNTARVRELVPSDRRLTAKMIADEVNTNRETVRLILTEPGNRSFDTNCRIGDEKNLRQDGAKESHRAAAGCTVERSFYIQMHYEDAAASLLT